jgi:hypothetical protein
MSYGWSCFADECVNAFEALQHAFKLLVAGESEVACVADPVLRRFNYVELRMLREMVTQLSNIDD